MDWQWPPVIENVMNEWKLVNHKDPQIPGTLSKGQCRSSKFSTMMLWRRPLYPVILLVTLLEKIRITPVDGFRPTTVILAEPNKPRPLVVAANPTALCKSWMESAQRFPRTFLFSAIEIKSISREVAENHEEDTRSGAAFAVKKDKNTTRLSADSFETLPWSDSQEWALRDNVEKYTIQVAFDGRQLKRMIRWRSLLSNTPELAGYPIDFVIARYETSSLVGTSDVSTEVLPFLDNFRFETNGGLSGLVYGIRGIQGGTRIRTDPVSRVEHSIPLGYVATEDSSVVYELGLPEETRMDTKQSSSIVDSQTGSSRIYSNDIKAAQRGLTNIFDPELVQLGGLTVVVLTGAWAMQTLSHHLTVNIFWV